MSKESIINKIISDAEIRANSFIEEQTSKADEILAQAAEECKNYFYNFKAETDRMIADLDARSKTVADLDARKIMLATKTRSLDDVFARALQKVCSLDKDTCRKLLIGMLVDAAEDGDVVTLGKNQKDCLSREDVAKAAKDKDIKLTLSDKTGDFDGMILSGNGVDKNLTFEVEIDLIREETETEIAKEIFA